MTRSELLELIANGENSGVEFKRDDIRPEQLAKEVVALANFQGGKIILGVEAVSGFSGAFLTMAATGLLTAILVGFVRNHTGNPLD